MSREETLRRVYRVIDKVRDREGRLGHAFQAVVSSPERLTIPQLENLEAALVRVAEILDERNAGSD